MPNNRMTEAGISKIPNSTLRPVDGMISFIMMGTKADKFLTVPFVQLHSHVCQLSVKHCIQAITTDINRLKIN